MQQAFHRGARSKGEQVGDGFLRVLGKVLVGIYVLLLLVPLYYLLVSAFKDNTAIFTNPLGLPIPFSLQNFANAQDGADLLSAMGNSALITIGAEVVTLLLAIPAAYGIARIPSRLGGLFERIFALGFLIPTFAVLVPTFLFSITLGLFHTRLFLVLFYPATALPLAVVLLTQFMRSIPGEIEEAARVDGARRWQILLGIFIPLSWPGIATILILNFLSFWNEYIFALVILDQDTRTVQVALPTLMSYQLIDYGLLTAGTVITLIPVYIVYAVLQRRMQEALVSGYAKG